MENSLKVMEHGLPGWAHRGQQERMVLMELQELQELLDHQDRQAQQAQPERMV